MFVLAIIELESYLSYSGYIIYFPWIINFSPPLILLLGPLSFLHLKNILNLNGSSKRNFGHFIPAIAYTLYSLFFFLQPETFKITAALKNFRPESITTDIASSFSVDPLNIQGIVVIEGLAIHLLIYSMVSVFYVINIRFRNPKVDIKIDSANFQWANFWIISLLVGSILFLMTGGIINGYILYNPILPAYSVNLFCTGIVYAATIFWIGRKLSSSRIANKYAKSNLTSEHKKFKFLKLKVIMDTQKPYKSQDFSLSHLAKLANLSTHHTSQVVNEGAGMTFNEFVNQYRVEEARSILQSSSENQIKIEVLAYQVGYKSKSAFFNSFRRYTKTTPAQFRELSSKE